MLDLGWCSISRKNNWHYKHKIILVLFVYLLGVGQLLAEETQIAMPNQLVAPKPLLDGSGLFFCPYTEDAVITEWIDKGIELDIGSELGGIIGAELANQALSEIPVVGSYVGKKVGEHVGSRIALSAIGGEEYIRSTSDQSFQTAEELAVYMYVKYSSHKDYKKVLGVTTEVYPELRNVYYSAIVQASEEAFAFEVDLSD